MSQQHWEPEADQCRPVDLTEEEILALTLEDQDYGQDYIP